MERIPPEVLAALSDRNPYRIQWGSAAAHAAYLATTGREREVAEMLLSMLSHFPPSDRYFRFVGAKTKLSAGTYVVSFMSDTHFIVEITVEYHEARQVALIRSFSIRPKRGARN